MVGQCPWLDLRQIVLLRDKHHCVKCGAEVRGKREAIVDHIKPRSTHPDLELDLDNLRVLCVRCHNQGHLEKLSAAGNGNGERIERFLPKGCDINGWPREILR